MSARDLFDHLSAADVTTVCRAWELRRADGRRYGFTDHDRDLSFDGLVFRADSGMSAQSLVQGTGLSVDNTEAQGVLTDGAINEAEIEEGRFDGAEVMAWLVNWADVEARSLRFRGRLGELRRGAGAFEAELRGLTDNLNQPQGRVYHRDCPAVLGDVACGVDMSDPAFAANAIPESVEDDRVFRLTGLGAYADRWFERGRLRVQTGAATGLDGVIKRDRLMTDGGRLVELWAPIRAAVTPFDQLRLEAGCDKRSETCKLKFHNFNRFRGFPHIPGEDWLASVPRSRDVADGGSLNS